MTGSAFSRSGGSSARTLTEVQALDLATVRLEPVTVEGLSVVALSEIEAESLFELFAATRVDIPAVIPRHELTRAEFRREVLPNLDRDASVVAVARDEPVGLAFVRSDRAGGRALAEMTGVRREHRGRGIATLVKVESLRRARDLGVRTMLTENDVANVSMLAVNRRLGFWPTFGRASYEKVL